MSEQLPPAAAGTRPDGIVGQGGIPLVIDSLELAHLMHAVMNDKSREQWGEDDNEHFQKAMATLLRAAQTPWQAHPDHLRVGIASVLQALEDVLEDRGLYDREQLQERAGWLQALADWTHDERIVGLHKGDPVPCGPPEAVAKFSAESAEPAIDDNPDGDRPGGDVLRSFEPLRVVKPTKPTP